MVKIEGLVIKNYNRQNMYGRQIFAKIVNEDFKETNRAVFGKVKQDTGDTSNLVKLFCNEARIKKKVLYLINEEGFAMDRKLMKKLPILVCMDILKEEYGYLLKIKTLHIHIFKQLVAKECLYYIDKHL